MFWLLDNHHHMHVCGELRGKYQTVKGFFNFVIYSPQNNTQIFVTSHDESY
jgi:hypothetical protein